MFSAGIVMQKAFTCGLREALVRDGWIVCEGNLAVWSGSDLTQLFNSEPTEVVEFVSSFQGDIVVNILD